MQSKPVKLIFTAVVAAFVATGCSDESNETVVGNQPISFANNISRAPAISVTEGMESFLVWGGFDNTNNLFDATLVTPQGYYDGNRYWAPGKTHNFYALHPASLTGVSCNEDGVRTITDFDTSKGRGKDAVDIMTAQYTGVYVAPETVPQSVPFRFQHELSRVSFSITSAEPVTISDVKLRGMGYVGNFTTAPQTAQTSWTITKTAGENDNTFTHQTTQVDAGGQLEFFGGDLLLIPQTLENCYFTMTWTYTESGETRTVNTPLSSTAMKEWTKGKSYRYSAEIPSPNKDVTVNVTVGDWNAKKTIQVEL